MRDPIQRAIEAERDLGADRRYRAFEQLRRDMGTALAYQLGGPEPEGDGAIRCAGMNFFTMVETLLGFRGERPWSARSEMISRGILSGDVPELLAGAGNRILRKEYGSYSSGLLRLCEQVESRDFRDVKAIQVDGDVVLMPLGEGGAFAEGNVSSSAETFKIETFGRILGLSRVLLADDDLAAFSEISKRLGRMAAEFVAGKISATLEANAALADGTAAFHASHGNLGTAGALSETTLGELLKLMRSAKGLGGESVAVEPRALVVPAALEMAARKLIASITPGNAAPPLDVIVEPRLSSATGYYLLSDPSTVAAISYSYAAGQTGPRIDVAKRRGFTGLQARVALDFGCGFTDHRGAAKNAGQ